MSNDLQIGRVVSIDTAQITIELSRELRALTRTTFEGTTEVGKINSYVILPVGSQKIVGIITRVVMSEEAELRSDKTTVTLPSARRLIRATLIGSIEDGEFHQGLSVFPLLDNDVLVTTNADIEAIFGRSSGRHASRFIVPIGTSAIFPTTEVRIDPDVFFGKHAAIIGSTGSGKSCSVATILQSLLQLAPVKNTHFVVLDTNGEYRAAFQRDEGGWNDLHANYRTLYIPSESAATGHLAIPYWFMNSDDFTRLFRAAPGVQRPVLLNALRLARESQEAAQTWRALREDILTEGNRILAAARGEEGRDAKMIRQLCDDLLSVLNAADAADERTQLQERYPTLTQDYLVKQFSTVRDIVREGIRSEGTQYEAFAPVGAGKRRRIETAVEPVLSQLTTLRAEAATATSFVSADTPNFFDKFRFRNIDLDRAMSREEANSSRTRENSATMLMRIYRLMEDKRFDFLFGPVDSQWPDAAHGLAAFLRDILGLPRGDQPPDAAVPEDILPFYDRQRSFAGPSHNVVIVDLSLLTSEVLENVTGLIGRLILEFLQRCGDKQISGIDRGAFPVVLILEEAQNYIRERRADGEESISRTVFERIAREGRKFGLGLVVASQRPSELSKTVLSQCNSFVVHRLQNPEDLHYFRQIVPGIYDQMLEQLPALAPRNALVLGDAVPSPAIVYMREANPTPHSRDPQFYGQWTRNDPASPNVEAVCSRWEGVLAEPEDNNQIEGPRPDPPETDAAQTKASS